MPFVSFAQEFPELHFSHFTIKDDTSLPCNDNRFISENKQHKFRITTGRFSYGFYSVTEKRETINIFTDSTGIGLVKIMYGLLGI
jgi:hypothetical protein